VLFFFIYYYENQILNKILITIININIKIYIKLHVPFAAVKIIFSGCTPFHSKLTYGHGVKA